MDLTVVAYLLYLAVVVPLTIWVGRALRRHGEVFLVDVFAGDDRLAHSVNQLLVIGFYLLNFGFLLQLHGVVGGGQTGRELMELLSSKVGRRGPGDRPHPPDATCGRSTPSGAGPCSGTRPSVRLRPGRGPHRAADGLRRRPAAGA